MRFEQFTGQFGHADLFEFCSGIVVLVRKLAGSIQIVARSDRDSCIQQAPSEPAGSAENVHSGRRDPSSPFAGGVAVHFDGKLSKRSERRKHDATTNRNKKTPVTGDRPRESAHTSP
jgi:hypothetical protein